jgi:gliding motility-associated-like protein
MVNRILFPALFIFFQLIIGSTIQAQQLFNNVWHFGNNCKLDFSSGTPVAGYSEIFTNEGSSSICDANGQNLFYTDGSIVWKADGTQINQFPESLGGGSSSTQSSLIVPFPGNSSKFYIFTTVAELSSEFGEYHGTNVSLLDITGNGGIGSFDYMNTVLLDSSCEKLTAIKQCGGDVYWIIAHKWQSADFYAWKLTSGGIEAPVISTIGSFVPNTPSYIFGELAESIGYLKASSNGNKIASAYTFRTPAVVELFDFDFNTGQLSNPMSDTISLSGDYSAYGVCFSPDDTKLYFTEDEINTFTTSKLVQYDATASSQSAFSQSRSVIGTFNLVMGAIEIGPDNKLYVAQSGSQSLGVINEPNLPASQCNFVQDAVNLAPNTICTFGLQNVVAGSAIDYSSNLILADTIVSCSSELVLDYVANSGSILWSTGDTTHQTLVNNEGFYYLEVNSICSVVKDTVYAAFNGNFSLSLPSDTILCFSDSLLVLPVVSNPDLNFQWSTGQTTLPLTITNSGLYELQMSYTSCIKKDSIFVDFKTIPKIDLGPDVLLCNTPILSLGKSIPNVTFLWSDGSIDSTLSISNFGEYWLKISNGFCEDIDSIRIEDATILSNLTIPNAFSPNNDLINDEFVAGETELKNYSMTVYNRWGDELFHAQNPTQFWNGKYKDSEVPEGVYMWICSYLDPCTNDFKEKKGTVSLFR